MTAHTSWNLHKTIAYKILSPVLEGSEKVHLTCREGSFEQLITALAIRQLDMPVNSAYSIKAYNHKLGESPLTCFAVKKLAS